ncbi:MAG: bifunctional 3-deoxy-7-phosphoheptulonate synthase/chorismate mutase [Christensenellales bacterium]|jgi:3-deoxy-7-phosphoheptulonate synthase
MVIVLKPGASVTEKNEIISLLTVSGLKVHISEGAERTIIGIIGDKSRLTGVALELLPGVEKLVPIMESYKLASRTFNPEGTVIDVKGRKIGGAELALIAGPCAIESEEQIYKAAEGIKKAGAKFLRGGAFKPRTSPYSFQGLAEEGLKLMRAAADEYDLIAVSEIISENDMELALKYIDIIQIGARNAQNFRLLKEAGRCGLPVLLKRGIATTIDEMLGSAEYIMSEGNYNIILCERGIRTFETATRNTLDISAVPVLKSKTHLPVIIDPSHATGRSSFIPSMAMASVAAGADGLLIEVHPNPKYALSDAAQQLSIEEFIKLTADIAKIAGIVGKTI